MWFQFLFSIFPGTLKKMKKSYFLCHSLATSSWQNASSVRRLWLPGVSWMSGFSDALAYPHDDRDSISWSVVAFEELQIKWKKVFVCAVRLQLRADKTHRQSVVCGCLVYHGCLVFSDVLAYPHDDRDSISWSVVAFEELRKLLNGGCQIFELCEFRTTTELLLLLFLFTSARPGVDYYYWKSADGYFLKITHQLLQLVDEPQRKLIPPLSAETRKTCRISSFSTTK